MNIKGQQGFTLVEIAIVLVIIGLLLGGVLKGQQMIASAKVKSQIQQLDGIGAASTLIKIDTMLCPEMIIMRQLIPV